MTRQHRHISISSEPHIWECSRVAQVIFPRTKTGWMDNRRCVEGPELSLATLLNLNFFLDQTKKIAFLEIVKDIVLNADNIPSLVSSRPIY